MRSSLTLSSTAGHSSTLEDAITLRCWSCSAALAPLDAEKTDAETCAECRTVTRRDQGIWRSLSPETAQRLQKFIAEYESIRTAEERGSEDAAYYLALPFVDLTGKLSEQWRIRALTYKTLVSRIVEPLTARFHRPLRILDLGAGNGWLSYRLALLGHIPVAVDLVTNARDGLGAGIHFCSHLPHMFPRVQASSDSLPFIDGSFDLAIFNASFHYSEDYAETLAEALRCTRLAGAVVIADTPWYPNETDGLAMAAEKRACFRSLYGFASDSLDSGEFFTPQRMRTLSAVLDVKWTVFKPFYGIDWMLRPLRARLRGKRRPSQFRIFMAEATR